MTCDQCHRSIADNGKYYYLSNERKERKFFCTLSCLYIWLKYKLGIKEKKR